MTSKRMSKKGDTKSLNEYTDLKNRMELLAQENKELNSKIDELLKSTKFMSDMYDENANHMKEIKSQLQEIKNQNKALLEENADLKKEINVGKKEREKMEQNFLNILMPIELERRQNNLELHGLPESQEENCSNIIKDVLKHVTPEPIEISNCYRFGRTDNSNEKPRRILIQFADKQQRDDIYNKRKNLKKLDKPIYLNENLPRYLSVLRGKANTKRKEQQYKFIWMKNGTILLRKDELSEVITVRYTSDLDKIV